MPSPSRRQLLASLAAGMGVLPLGRAAWAGGSERKRVLLVFAEGGWDVSFCLDPKLGLSTVDGPDADEDPEVVDDREAVETIHGLPVVLNDVKRPSARTFFEGWGQRTAIVNGIWVGAIAHATARVRVLNGTALESSASWPAIAGSAHGGALPLGSVDIAASTYVGDLGASVGQLGFQAQLRALLDPDAAFAPIEGWQDRPTLPPQPDDVDALYAHLRARNAAVRGQGPEADAFFAGRDEALERAHRFRGEGGEAISGLALGTRPRFIDQLDLAVQLLDDDLCAAATVDSQQAWDTHRTNSAQHGYWESLFSGLVHLAQTLDARDLWDDTLVVVTSEMTRTPTFNSTLGKDHWPHTSMMVLGRRTRGGQVFGGTDDRIESLPIDPVTGQPDPAGRLNRYDHAAAGILASLDVDPEPHFPTIEPFLAWTD